MENAKQPTTPTASVKLEGANLQRFNAVKDHMTTVLVGLNPTNADVLAQALALAENAIKPAQTQAVA